MLILVAAGGLSYWMYRENEEKKKRQLEAAAKAAQELAKPKRPTVPGWVDGSTGSSPLVGKKARVSHKDFFTALGGLPVFAAASDAANCFYSELKEAKPGATVQPINITRDLAEGRGVKLFGNEGQTIKVTRVPVETECDVLSAHEFLVMLNTITVLKVRTHSTPPVEGFVHELALAPAAP